VPSSAKTLSPNDRGSARDAAIGREHFMRALVGIEELRRKMPQQRL
jgi:hypothetical protein